jgi:hypothetical protein
MLEPETHSCEDDLGGVDAERGVAVIAPFSLVSSLLQCFSGGVRLCGRELFVIGVGGSCEGDGLAKFGECCLRGDGELGVIPSTELFVPAN